MNKASILSDALCEAAVGATQEQMDAIMDIVSQALTDIKKTGKAKEDFERLVNDRLSEAGYPIQFDSNDAILIQYRMPARAGLDGIVIATPSLDYFDINQVRMIISHEAVHAYQINAADTKGDAEKMFDAAHRRMMPKGELKHKMYLTDPHEVMAHARSLIDQWRTRRISKKQAFQMLKTMPLGYKHDYERNRFLKHAAAYAQDLPESIDDPSSIINSLADDFESWLTIRGFEMYRVGREITCYTKKLGSPHTPTILARKVSISGYPASWTISIYGSWTNTPDDPYYNTSYAGPNQKITNPRYVGNTDYLKKVILYWINKCT